VTFKDEESISRGVPSESTGSATDALKQIWTERGFQGVTALLSQGGSPHEIGKHQR